MRLLTPYGTGGIAVVVVEPAERTTVLACLRGKSGGPVALCAGAPPRRCDLVLDGEVVDDVIAVDRCEGLELHLHGSPGVLERVARSLGPFQVASVRPAEQLLRDARSDAQLDLALEQMGYDFDAALAEAGRLPNPQRHERLGQLVDRSRVARALAEPYRVVLAGRQNAGKSTLFNRLLFVERALTGPMPGLTRDPLREVTTLAGYPYELIDTAGEGVAVDAIDALAQQRGRVERAAADVILVVDGSVGPTAEDLAMLSLRPMVIATKSDLAQAPWPAAMLLGLRVSCADPATSVGIRTAVGEALRCRRGLPVAGAVGGPAALDETQRLRLLAATGAASLSSA
jgi:small GTP-binding protein